MNLKWFLIYYLISNYLYSIEQMCVMTQMTWNSCQFLHLTLFESPYHFIFASVLRLLDSEHSKWPLKNHIQVQ